MAASHELVSQIWSNMPNACVAWDNLILHVLQQFGVHRDASNLFHVLQGHIWDQGTDSTNLQRARKRMEAASARLQRQYGCAARWLRRENIQAQITLLDYSPLNPWFVVHFLHKSEISASW